MLSRAANMFNAGDAGRVATPLAMISNSALWRETKDETREDDNQATNLYPYR